jgi:hypothetical protein
MGLSAAEVEKALLSRAREEVETEHDTGLTDMEACGTTFTVCYLAAHPLDADTLRRREGAATAMMLEGDNGEGEAELRALLVHRRTAGPETLDTVRNLKNLVACLNRQQRFADAEAPARESLAVFQRLSPGDEDYARGLRSLLVQTLSGQRKYAEEETLLRLELAVLEAKPAAGTPVEEAHRLKIPPAASPAYRAYREKEAARQGTTAQRGQDRELGVWRTRLAACLHAQGKDEEAAALARKALAGFSLADDNATVREARQVLEEIGKGKGNSPAPTLPGER